MLATLRLLHCHSTSAYCSSAQQTMAVDEDTDTESVSGDYLDLGDIHTPTNGDGEFYECEDDEMDEEYFEGAV